MCSVLISASQAGTVTIQKHARPLLVLLIEATSVIKFANYRRVAQCCKNMHLIVLDWSDDMNRWMTVALITVVFEHLQWWTGRYIAVDGAIHCSGRGDTLQWTGRYIAVVDGAIHCSGRGDTLQWTGRYIAVVDGAIHCSGGRGDTVAVVDGAIHCSSGRGDTLQ